MEIDMHTREKKSSDDRFCFFNESNEKGAPEGWYYKTREGFFGPFHSQDDACNHLNLRICTAYKEQPSMLKRLVNIFTPQPEERRQKQIPLKKPLPIPEDQAPEQGQHADLRSADPRQTTTFDRPAELCQPMASDKFLRLPHNKTKVLVLKPGGEIEIYMASYRFVLSLSENNLQLTDDNGKTHLLYDGTSTIGRNTNNDIITDRNFTEISRYHLIFDWDGGDKVRLTDMSTLGTFVPPECLEE